MKLRFDVNDAALRDTFLRGTLLDALRPLQPDRQALWGGMTAQQMVEHLVWTFEVSSGRLLVECRVPEERREAMKSFLHHNRPTPPDFMNPLLRNGLPSLRCSTMPEALAVLRDEAARFLEQSRGNPGALHTHPIFGPIDVEEWSRTHFKHCVHHLLQFGLIELEP